MFLGGCARGEKGGESSLAESHIAAKQRSQPFHDSSDVTSLATKKNELLPHGLISSTFFYAFSYPEE